MDTQGRFRNFDSVFPVIILIGLTGFVTDQILASLRIYLFPWTSEAMISSAVHLDALSSGYWIVNLNGKARL